MPFRAHLKTVNTHRRWVRRYCFKLGLYRVGEGTLILNTFDLLDEAHRTPSAARMLVNLLDGI